MYDLRNAILVCKIEISNIGVTPFVKNKNIININI